MWFRPRRPKLFLSYRRQDAEDVVARIYDRLVSAFGREAVFKDVDSIPPGADFRERLREALGTADFVLLVIGPSWFGPLSEPARIHSPEDFVRLEVQVALERKVPILPILVHGGTLHAESLPDEIKPIAYLQTLEVRRDPDFHRDVDRLIAAIRAPRERQTFRRLAVVASVLAAALIGLIFLQSTYEQTVQPATAAATALPPSASRAITYLNEGAQSALDEGDNEVAGERLEHALRFARELGARGPLLARIHLLRAQIYAGGSAVRSLRLAACADPQQTLDPNRFGSELQKIYAETAARRDRAQCFVWSKLDSDKQLVLLRPTRDLVLAVMLGMEPEVRECAKDSFQGTAEAYLTVSGATGSVTHATVTGIAGTAGSCVARILRTARFPRFSQPEFSIKYPLWFEVPGVHPDPSPDHARDVMARLTLNGQLDPDAAHRLVTQVEMKLRDAADQPADAGDPIQRALSRAWFGAARPPDSIAAAKLRQRLYEGLDEWLLEKLFAVQPGAIIRCVHDMGLQTPECEALIAAVERSSPASVRVTTAPAPRALPR